MHLPEGMSGELVIKLSEPPTPITPNLVNERASSQATIVSIEFRAEILGDDDERPLTLEELDRVAHVGSEIVLRAESGDAYQYNAPGGGSFAVRDIIQAIEHAERASRGNTEWFGGVDVHHIFFEGLLPIEGHDAAWEIEWGS